MQEEPPREIVMPPPEEPLPDLSAMTVAQLKDFASDRGYSMLFKNGNKKADLIDAIKKDYDYKMEHYNSMQAITKIGDDFRKRRDEISNAKAEAMKKKIAAQRVIDESAIVIQQLESKEGKTVEEYDLLVKHYKATIAAMKMVSATNSIIALTGF